MKKFLLSFTAILFVFLNFFGAHAQTTLDFQNTGHNSYDYIGSPNLDLSISPKTIRFNYNNASSSGSQGGPNYYISDDGTGSSSNLGLTINEENTTDALTISYTDNSAFALNALKVIDYNALYNALYPGSGGPAHQLTIKAYSGSSLTATITYTYSYSGVDAYNRQTINTFSANAAFSSVTKVVITAAGGLDHMFDDVVIGTAASSSSAPTVTTTTPSAITSTSASLGGNVSSDGGASVTDRGIVYGASANPTVTNTKVQIGTGTGSFSQTITGLSTSTTYHVRAYAINSLGTSYGADQSFSTSAAPVPLSTTGTQTNVSCNGGSTGSATVNVMGGTAPYSYSWSPSGGTAATASGLSAGNYTVTVTDAASATATQSFTITQPSALSKTSSQTNVSCNGGSNGSASVSVSGGTAPYSYSWSPSGGTAATATGLSAGTYSITITDANGCTTTQNFTLTQPSALSSSGSQTNIACNGTSTGSASVSVSGGTAPYSYSWQNNTTGTTLPQTTASVNGLSAGSYTVNITDANGCTATQNYTLTQPSALATTGSQTNVSTYGGSNGSATVSVSGGAGGFTYSWSPSGGTAATASGLAAGNYTVTITDANGCTVSRNYTITQPAAVTAAPVITAPTNGSLSNNRTPTHTGTAPANSTVTLYVDGTVIGTTITNGGGSFSLTQPAALTDGSHTVYATAQSSGRTVSANSNTNTFTTDATAPAAPIVLSPANGSVLNNNRPSVSGTAEANSSIKVFVDGTLQVTTMASASGNYTFQLTTALAEGSHTVHTMATDGAGNTSPNSNTNTFTIDQTAPSVTISSTASGSTANSTIPVMVNFSEAVTGFTASDVAVTGGTLSGFSGSGSNYSFTVTASAPGTITVGIAANSAQDAAGNGTAASQFSIVYAPVSSNADLSNLAISSGVLSPGFASGTTSYSASVGNATSSITITPITTNANATVTVNSTAVTSGTATSAIPLAVGSNTIQVAVTAQDGTTQKIYTLNIIRPASSVATLSNLSISSGTPSPAFASGTASYSASVTNAVSSISVTPTTSDANATVTVNGTIVNSGTASGAIPLAVGANTIQTVITAQDGATTQTYTLTVTRASAAIITTSVASLPAFASCYSNASGPQSFTVTGSGLSSDIAVLPPAGFQISQTSGGPYYGAGVTLAQTGGAVSATVYARMAAATSSPSPGNITLSATGATTQNVAVSGTQNARPTIDLGTITSVTSASASFSLPYTATTGSPDVYSIFTGSNAMSGFAIVNNARLTGSPMVIAMPAGTAAGRYDFYLTATNSSTGCISYSNYFAVNVGSTAATLSNLSISSGTLSPAFSSGTTNYSASVSYATTSLTITPTASDTNATITVNGTSVSSGSASSTIPLTAGSNTITTVVTAQDGTTTKTYLLTIIRAAASMDANLSSLAISSGTFTPGFTPGTTSYSASVSNTTTSIIVTPITSNANANVTVNGVAVSSGSAPNAIPLAVGSNTVMAVVTAQDGTTTKTYTLNINRAQAAQNITFATLMAKTYGDADFALSATASSGLPITYASSDPAVATVDASGSVHILAAGTTTITANQQGNANYSPATAVTQTLTVNKASLTISANNKTKAYGNANPALTLTYSGFVKGETAADLTVQPTAGTTATTASDAGSYPIIATGAASSNYDFTYVNGTLTIEKANNVVSFVAIPTKTYGDADFSLNATASSGLPVTYASSNPAVATVDAAGKIHILTAGVTTISASQQGNNNYDAATVVNQSLIVGKAALMVKAEDKTRTQGTANPALTVSYTGFVGTETESVLSSQPVISTAATVASAAGTYPVTVSGAQAANYSITYVPGTLTVTSAAVNAINLTPVTLYENQSAGTLAGTLSAASANPNAVFTYTFSGGNGAADNASFSLSGNKLLTMASFDYETKSSYSVRIRATDQYGQSAEQTFTIQIADVNEAPVMARVLDEEVCLGRENRSITLMGISPGPETGQNVTLNVQSSNPGLFNGLGVSSVSGGRATLNYSLAGTGTAVVTITARDDGGTANGGTDSFSETFTITSHALPSALISSDKGTLISKGDIVTLTATGGDSYSWDAAPNAGGTNSSAVIGVRPDKTTTYQVKVNNASGCSSLASITIEVADDYALIQPANILTPNGDGKNDTWVVKNIDLYPNHTISIYDRGGRRLIEVKHYDNSWDGSVNGLPLTEGTYYYVIDFGEGKALKKGFITILRNR